MALLAIDIDDEKTIDILVKKLAERLSKELDKPRDPDEMLTPKEACDFLGIRSGENSVNANIRARTSPKGRFSEQPLKATRGVGSTMMFKISDLEAFQNYWINKKNRRK